MDVPAEPADLEEVGAVPPLVTEINLSPLDDRFPYVLCWDTTSVHLGGIVRRTPHPRSGPLNGASQKVEVSRDGRRVYFSNAPYSSWVGSRAKALPPGDSREKSTAAQALCENKTLTS